MLVSPFLAYFAASYTAICIGVASRGRRRGHPEEGVPAFVPFSAKKHKKSYKQDAYIEATAIAGIFAMTFRKLHSEDAAFTRPMHLLQERDPERAYRVLGIMAAMNQRLNLESNASRPVSSTIDAPAKVFFVTSVRPGQPVEELAESVCAKFSAFANEDEDFIGNHNEFTLVEETGVTTADPPRCIREFVRDKDTHLFARKMNPGMSKEDILADETILTQYYGSPEIGRELLEELTAEDFAALD